LKRFFSKATAVIVGLIITLMLIEGVLNVWTPFEYRVRGDKIVLPVNRSYVMTLEPMPGMDTEVIHSKNGLGFRGAERLPTAAFEKALTIVAVGGSTTESFYISDGKTWPEKLAQRLSGDFPDIWMNNAGLDGHSTFGHRLLMTDFLIPLQPDVVLFLIGANDNGRRTPGQSDLRSSTETANRTGIYSWVNYLANNTEIGGLALAMYRVYQAHKMGLGHSFTQFDWESFPPPDTVTAADAEAIYAQHREGAAIDYRKRVIGLIEQSRSHGIEPVLMTQPHVLGSDSDPRPGAAAGDTDTWTVTWQVLEIYNDVVRTVAVEQDVLLIDLARKLPKDRHLFYDSVHFNIPGSDRVAKIIAAELCPWLAEKFPESHQKQSGEACR